MEILHYITILRRRWLLVALPGLVAFLVSLGVALAEPPRYAATARVLVQLDAPARVDIEDALAYDLAAIVRGRPLAADVAAQLAASGRPVAPEDVAGALSATNLKREVTLTATAGDPDTALALLQTAIALLRKHGLAYWSVGAPTEERPGLIIGELAPPTAAGRVNGVGALIRVVALRTLAGLACGAALALALHFFARES
jgi:hypothetical protein